MILSLSGGPFDPLGLASGDKAANLKEAEIKHARLAMVAFLGEFRVKISVCCPLASRFAHALHPLNSSLTCFPCYCLRLLRAGFSHWRGCPRIPDQVR